MSARRYAGRAGDTMGATVVRVSTKFVGAVILVLAFMMLCMIVAWAIDDWADPTEKLYFVVGLSLLGGLFIIALTVYRMITQLRSAVLILAFSSPLLVSFMYGLFFLWPIVHGALQLYAPWAVDAFDALRTALKWIFNHLFG